jgi:hypothetical protein
VRYADDFVLGFQHDFDAQRFLGNLRERLARFRLELNPDKTRLLLSGGLPPPSAKNGVYPARAAGLQLPRADALLQSLAEWVVPVIASHDAFAFDGQSS